MVNVESTTIRKDNSMTLSPNRPPGSTVGRREDGDISLGRIHQRTTPGTVAGVLRTAILDGTLAPGSQLREAHIAADLGVSRAPLREALSILADELSYGETRTRDLAEDHAVVPKAGERSVETV